MVYYLGDSIARESTVSDGRGPSMLGRKAGASRQGRGAGCTLAGHNQTFGMDEKLVGGLPATPVGQPEGILLIGVGISRFIGPPTPQDAVSPDPAVHRASLSPWEQHLYDGRAPLSARAQAASSCRAGWTAAGPASRRNKTANLAAIGRLVAPRRPRACAR